MAINPRKAGSVLSYVYIFLSNSISLVYTPFMLSMLGQSEYGLFGTANSITSYLSLLSMGVGGAYIKFNAEARANHDREKEIKLNGMFQTIYTVISIVTAIVGAIMIFCSSYIFSAKYTPDELIKIKLIMTCTVLQMIVTFMFNTTAMALQAYEKFIFIRVTLIISCCIQPIINIIALNMGGKAVSISIATLIVSTLTYLSFFAFARRKIDLKFSFKDFDKKVLKSVFIFSGFLFMNSITDQLTFTTDNLILGIVSGSVIVAIYTIGSSFKGYFMMFSSSVSGVFAPQINRIIASGDEDNINDDAINDIFVRVGRVQFLIVTLLLTGYIFVGKQFIMLWAGADYGDSYLIGLLLMLAIYVPCFQNVGLEIQKAKNMHKARSVVFLLIAIVNVIITIPFSMLWQGMGAALATLICMFCGTVIFMNIYNHKCVGIDEITFWKNIAKMLPGLIIPAIVGVAILNYFPIDSYLTFILAAIIYCVVYCISVWFISMNAYERDLIKSPIVKIFRKIFRKG